MTRRFVILVHRGHGPLHYDLLLEQGDALATWQFETNPAEALAEKLPCRRLPDHRRIYLDYQGPISGERGQVQRVESGLWQPLCITDARWEFELSSEEFSGRFVLQAHDDADEAWQWQRLTPAPPTR
jgi:hypothetical protein